jgi:CRP-like cAMP-binding protein
MGCPHPLDPLCIAIMLRLAQGHASDVALASEMDVPIGAITSRLNRLSAIGAVTEDTSQAEYRLQPESHQIIIDITKSGLNGIGSSSTARERSGYRNRLSRLKNEPLFQSLPSDELDWLAHVSRTHELESGELLFLEGDECRGLYIVDTGTIRLSKTATSRSFGLGREQTIRLMSAGESFNEVPVFDDGPNPVSAEALESASVIVVKKSDVRTLVERSPEFAGVIIRILSQRLRHFIAMVEDVSMRDVTGRVAKILLQEQHPSDGVGAGVRTGRRLTQREIAEMAGTAREVVARALKKLERTGALRVDRGRVQILDPDLLESLV